MGKELQNNYIEIVDYFITTFKDGKSIKGGFLEKIFYNFLPSMKKMFKKGEIMQFDDFLDFADIKFDKYGSFIITYHNEDGDDEKLSIEESNVEVLNLLKLIYLDLIDGDYSTEERKESLSNAFSILNKSYQDDKYGDDDNDGEMEKASDNLLKIVNDNMEYLTKKENLPQLGMIMWAWENIYHLGRVAYGYEPILNDDIAGQCENNPKYEIENGSKIDYPNEEVEDTVYSAWAIAVDACHSYSDNNLFSTPKMILEGKKPILNESEQRYSYLENKLNKTMDEWIEFHLHDKYPYKLTIKNKSDVIHQLFNTIGGGYEWNKEGFLTRTNHGTENEYFTDYKYQLDNLPPNIKKDFLKVLEDENVNSVCDISYKYIDDAISKRVLDKAKIVFDDEALKTILDLSDDELTDLNNRRAKKGYTQPITTDINNIPDDFLITVYETYMEIRLNDIHDSMEEEENAKKKFHHDIIIGYSNISKIPENVNESYIPYMRDIIQEIITESKTTDYHNRQSDIEANTVINMFPDIFSDLKTYPFITAVLDPSHLFETITIEHEDNQKETIINYKSGWKHGDNKEKFYHYEIHTDLENNVTRRDFDYDGNVIKVEENYEVSV